MARVKGYTPKQQVAYQQNLITKRCKGLMAMNDITQKDVAEYLEMSEATISVQFKNGKITLPVLIGIIKLANADVEELLRIKE